MSNYIKRLWEEYDMGILVALFLLSCVVAGLISNTYHKDEVPPKSVQEVTPQATLVPEVPETWTVESIEWSISGYKFITDYNPDTLTLRVGSCAEQDIFFDYRSDMHNARLLERTSRFLAEPMVKCIPVEKVTIQGTDFRIHESLAQSGIAPHYITDFTYTLVFRSNKEQRVTDLNTMLLSESHTNIEITFVECMGTISDFQLSVKNGKINWNYRDLCE